MIYFEIKMLKMGSKSWFSVFPMQNQTIDALFKSGKRRNHSQRLQISKEPHSDLYHPHLNSFSI